MRIQFEFIGDEFVQLYEGFGLKQNLAAGPGQSLSTILKRCNLQVKDKLILAHVTTVAFWQFYDTDLQHRKWTSDNIIFMSQADKANAIPINPYISVDLEAGDSEHEEHFIRKHLIHRYPRLLALAIILIEIGLNDTLQRETRADEVHQSNQDWNTAIFGLERLKQAAWGGFSNKSVYEDVIHACLQSKNYDVDTKDNQKSTVICQRRQAIHNQVVGPIQRLVETGFPASNEQVRCFELKRTVDIKLSEPVIDPGIRKGTLAHFHGEHSNPLLWLDDLVKISARILKLRARILKLRATTTTRLGNNCAKVKVAILDTGCDPSAQCFIKKPGLLSNIKAWKDFTTSISEEKVDVDGHGTFMAALLSSTAPIAELHIARVAKSSDDILGSSSSIVEVSPQLHKCTYKDNTLIGIQAIQWAAMKQEVDIISMSFGFQACHTQQTEDIKNAIMAVVARRKSKIIILASAGNFGPAQDEAFPACHHCVISMRATDPMGTFHSTNPTHDALQAIVLGTFGDSLPSWLTDCDREVYKPGSSAATAVAAGIAAFVLEHANILNEAYGPSPDLEKMRTWEGMKRVLERMSSDKGNRQYFLNPVAFYGNLKHDELYYKFNDILRPA